MDKGQIDSSLTTPGLGEGPREDKLWDLPMDFNHQITKFGTVTHLRGKKFSKVVDTIDVKNMDLRIKNIKNMFFIP